MADCCCCGSCAQAGSTSNANASVCQNPCCNSGCGGFSGLASSLNAIGKWGSVITAQVQGKAVAVNKNGVAIGAKGASTLPGQFSGSSMLLILVVVAVLLFVATRK